MRKNKKPCGSPLTICTLETYTAEENETRFKKDYEFNKPRSVRSPVSGWEDKYIREGSFNASPQEVSMVKGTAHTFKGMRLGNRYGSRPAGHRIGSRVKPAGVASRGK